MNTKDFQFKKASISESDEIARLFRDVRQSCMPYLPNLHSLEEDKLFFKNHVLKTTQVWIAVDDQTIVGFCACREGWLDHLYIHPDYHNQGIGSRFVKKVKSIYPVLQLWAFQKNIQACRFYEKHGFTVAKMTDGSGNEEKEPDILYIWERKRKI